MPERPVRRELRAANYDTYDVGTTGKCGTPEAGKRCGGEEGTFEKRSDTSVRIRKGQWNRGSRLCTNEPYLNTVHYDRCTSSPRKIGYIDPGRPDASGFRSHGIRDRSRYPVAGIIGRQIYHIRSISDLPGEIGPRGGDPETNVHW